MPKGEGDSPTVPFAHRSTHCSSAVIPSWSWLSEEIALARNAAPTPHPPARPDRIHAETRTDTRWPTALS
jgi:hypothetical protein